MASLSELYGKRQTYYNLRSSIEQLIYFLNNSINSLEDAVKISDFYSINTISADLNKTSNNYSELINKKVFLSSKVIPAIDSEISSISNEIHRIEEEMRRAAEARRRAEEARRRAGG